MKKIDINYAIILILYFIFNNSINAQITKINIKETPKPEQKYDSLTNYLKGDVYKYLNQTLYVLEKEEMFRKYGYKGFVKDYKYEGYDSQSNTYMCCDSYNSKYEELKEKYFKVIAIHEKKEKYSYGTTYFLKLEEQESKNIVYFKYSTEYKHTFPFLVVGYFEKQKKLLIGKKKIIRHAQIGDYSSSNDTWTSVDLKTGKQINLIDNDIWKCLDLTIEDKDFKIVAIIQNSKNEQTTISFDTFSNDEYTTPLKVAEKYKRKFGLKIYNLIMKREVKIGMNKEMCRISWGEPNNINSTISSGRNSEQWVYDENYLYFDNGILKTIQ